MRPTYLQFKSPDEGTPEFYYPSINYIGKKLSFSTSRSGKRLNTFSKAKRFVLLENPLVGPGSYSPEKAMKLLNPKTSMAKYVII